MSKFTRLFAIFILSATVFAVALPIGTEISYAQDRPSKVTIQYAEHPDSRPNLTALDIYPVEGATNYPVVIYVHGGAWRTGDKARVGSMPTFFHEAGYLFVSVNYRLTPKVDFPTHVEDVAAAIAWVHGHIADYGGNPDQLFLMGHSAGAHLVALVTTDSRYLAAYDLPLTTIKAVAPLDMPGYDFNALAAFRNGRLDSTFTRTFGTDPEGWATASPQTYVTEGIGIPPMVVVYNGVAGAFSISLENRADLNAAFVESLQAAGIEALLVPSPDQNHAQIRREFGTEGDKVSAEVLAFFDQYRTTE